MTANPIHFDETQHARAVNGRFAPMARAEPTGSLLTVAGQGGRHDELDHVNRLQQAEQAVEDAQAMLARSELLRSATALQALPDAVRRFYPDAMSISIDRFSKEVMEIHNRDGSTADEDPANVIGWGGPMDPDKVAAAVDWDQLIDSGSASVLDEGDCLHVRLRHAADEGARLSRRLG